MPTYTNANTVPFILNSPPLMLSPGQSAAVNYYIKPKNLPSGVTMTSSSPVVSPWALLATLTDATGDPVDTSDWDQVIVHNASNGVIEVVANGDTGNPMTILPNTKETLTDVSTDLLHCDSAHRFRAGVTMIGTLQVTSAAGTGSIFIYGYGTD